MAGSFNQITIVGNVVRDPETKNIQSGTAVTNFSLAVNRPPNKNAQEGAQSVDYFRVVAWDKLAETCNTYLKKGMSVLISGKMQMRQYVDKDGNKRESAEVVAGQMQMLGARNESTNGAVSAEGEHQQEPVAAAAAHTSSGANLDEEIPF